MRNLRVQGVFSSPRVEQVLLHVDHKGYVKFPVRVCVRLCVVKILRSLCQKDFAYVDAPQRVTFGSCETSLSAPHLHAGSLEVLEPVLVDGATVLDVGCGGGYLAAAMATMVGPAGQVFAVELHQECVDFAKANIRSHCCIHCCARGATAVVGGRA